MTDNELLLALSDLFDKKLKVELEPIKTDIKELKSEHTRTSLILENEIRGDIKLLAENYLPAAKRYEKSMAKLDAMQSDIDVIKSVIREHSERLQKIS